MRENDKKIVWHYLDCNKPNYFAVGRALAPQFKGAEPMGDSS